MAQFFSRHLASVLEEPDRYPQSFAVFLKQGSGWDIRQSALVIDPDDAHDVDTETGRVVASENWEYILEVSVVRQIIENLAAHVVKPTAEQRLAAFMYYFDHDAFWVPNGESPSEA